MAGRGRPKKHDKKDDHLNILHREYDKVMGEDTLKLIVKSRAEVVKSYMINGAPKFTRDNHKVHFMEGYDLLQYNIVVKNFIMRTFQVESSVDLDVLLYLFPFQNFTVKDFKKIPLPKGYTIKGLMSKAFVEIKIGTTAHGNKRLFGLTEYAANIVMDYYEYLCGHKTITPNTYKNPFRLCEQSKNIDKKREDLMVRMGRNAKNYPNIYMNKNVRL